MLDHYQIITESNNNNNEYVNQIKHEQNFLNHLIQFETCGCGQKWRIKTNTVGKVTYEKW